MKNITEYILLSCLTVLLTACLRDDVPAAAADDDGTVTLTVSMVLPEMESLQTRARTVSANNKSAELKGDNFNEIKLYMFIFEDTGSRESNYLRTLVFGSDITEEAPETEGSDDPHPNKTLRKFTAKVDGTSENAIIHLVATADPNFAKQLETTDRSELGLFTGKTGLYTEGQYPAYWKKIKLGMPINSANETAINQKLSHVQMVRNFARVTVSVDENSDKVKGFKLLGYTLVNVVDCGYVAAYSEAEPRGFVEFEKSETITDSEGNTTDELKGEMRDYSDIVKNSNYTGNRHPESFRIHTDNDTSWLNDDCFTEDPKYMFERPYQEQHRTFVIIKGQFTSSNGVQTIKYIKLDIGTAERLDTGDLGVFENYNLLRNFSYDIKIKSIASSANDIGSKTAQEAIVSTPANNISTSVETKSLQNMSDGRDRMAVNYTRVVIVDSDKTYTDGSPVPYPEYVDLWWRYMKDIDSNGNGTNVSNAVLFYPGMDPTDPTTTSEIFKSWEVLNSTPPTDYDRGYRLSFKSPGTTVKQEVIRLYYPSTDGTRLSRDITFIMRKRWEFVNKPLDDGTLCSNVEVYPKAYSFDDKSINTPPETLKEMREAGMPGKVESKAGAELTVMFELPEDLPQAIFPLEFTIGADRQNIENAYVGNATVVTGPTLFDDDEDQYRPDVQRTQFVKTVTWDYYNGSGDSQDKGHKLVCVRFLTTTESKNDVTNNSNDSEVTTRIRVKNPYFTLGDATFTRPINN